MKLTKLIKLILLCIALCITGCASADDKKEEQSVIAYSKTEATVENIASDYVFQVKNKNLIIYENDKKIDLTIEKQDGNYNIVPPEDGYKELCFYKIELKGDNAFINKKLKIYKTVVFFVKHEQKTKIKYQKNVYTDNKATVENERLLTDQKYQKNDIVMIGEDKNCQLLKIKQKTTDRQYSYEAPELDEVYAQLTVNEQVKNDFQHMEVNKEAVADYIHQQPYFQNIFSQTQAITANDISVETKEDKDNGITLTVLVQQENIKFKINVVLSYESQNIIHQTDFIASSHQLDIKLSYDIEGNKANELNKDIKKGASKAELKTIYQQHKDDTINMNDMINLMNIKIPVYGPLNYYLDMDLKNEWIMPANYENHSSLQIKAQLGFGLKNGKVYYQYADAQPIVTHDFQFSGTFKTDVGPQVAMGLNLMNDQQIGVLFDTNVLGEGEGIFAIDSEKTYLGNLRLNGYWDAYFMISILDQMMNISMLNQSHETLWSWFNIANADQLDSISIDSTYVADNGKIELGSLQAIFNNVLTNEKNEQVLNEYDIYIDGKEVEVSNGMVTVPESSIGKNCEILVQFTYLDENYQYKKTVSIEQKTEMITSFSEAITYLRAYLQMQGDYIPQYITADYDGNESYQEKGYLIHGYDEMGTHVVTSFWYYVASDGKIYDMLSDEYIN